MIGGYKNFHRALVSRAISIACAAIATAIPISISPKKARMIVTIRAPRDLGTMSPKPTVKAVMKAK